MVENKIGFNVDVNLDSKVTDKIYDDVAAKPLKLIGRAINAQLAPFESWIMLAEAERKNKLAETSRLIAEKHKNRNPEKIVSPEPYVVVPALQAISYSMDSVELRDMFANLLANSIDEDTKDNVHPSFVEIIKQLNPNDARLLKFFKSHNNKFIPKTSARFQLKINPDTNNIDLLSTTSEGFALCYSLLLNYTYDTYQDLENTEISVSNLNRLGLITLHNDYTLSNIDYSEFTLLPIIERLSEVFNLENLKNNAEEYRNYVIALITGSIEITSFGLNFINICIS